MESEEPEIKSKQASKRDRTLFLLIIIKGFSPHCILTDLTSLKLTLDPIPIIMSTSRQDYILIKVGKSAKYG